MKRKLLSLLCAAALLLQYGQEPEESCREIAPILAKNLTKSQIMRTIELLQKYRGECTYNVGTGHVLGASRWNWRASFDRSYQRPLSRRL